MVSTKKKNNKHGPARRRRKVWKKSGTKKEVDDFDLNGAEAGQQRSDFRGKTGLPIILSHVRGTCDPFR
jgi:hypothetical protein